MAKYSETSLAQNEITLAAVRDDALNALVKEGRGAAYTSEAHQTTKGLQVTTTNDRDHTHNDMVISGSASGERRLMHLDQQLTGNFTVDHLNGKAPEKDQFVLTGSDWDDWWGRDDKFNVSMSRKEASGATIQTYEPAISEPTSALDANGQPIRIAKPAGSDANCQSENIANPNNHRMECDFIIHDKNLGDLSYNQTREEIGGGQYYRSVVRDMKGKVLGIVEQNYHVDKNGNVTDIRTNARLPRNGK